ncbi:RidA family protein [Notoacmeibacter sp. MSK16QG-6]|uniref:RidA family protein n=1 Tax=Notoacmeibacter sp. MSK16QG-6 TaxID=2957982 RepID=UPI00209CA268|nr:RidA family protein [Notoacmeibacter sp. MSK16QG-6]MCP1199308.1 RidA family protein [Notoacmeibacter sp. MSK16QG-6]
MTNSIEERLAQAGIELPVPGAPVANYLAAVRAGDTLYISGQLPLQDGKVAETGLLTGDGDVERGQRAARQCAVNILAQAKAALDGFDAIERLIKIGVFVASSPEFASQHLVANGASDFLVEILGETIGKHARAAVGMSALPLDASVEIEAIFALKSDC